jgi:hypothetical protein
VWRRAALPGWTGPGRAMVWAVSTEVAVLWFVVLFWGGYGTRHAVGDEPATAAAAPPLSTTLVFADQSECFAGCDGVPFTEHMQETLQMGQLLALNRTLCFASGGNVTGVPNEAAEASGHSIMLVGHMPVEEATLGGGHLNCSATETWDSCVDATRLAANGAVMLGHWYDFGTAYPLGAGCDPGDGFNGYDYCSPKATASCEVRVGIHNMKCVLV